MKCKVKLEHMLENGSKLEFKGYVEAGNQKEAARNAKAEMLEAIQSVANKGDLTFDKIKVDVEGEDISQAIEALSGGADDGVFKVKIEMNQLE